MTWICSVSGRVRRGPGGEGEEGEEDMTEEVERMAGEEDEVVRRKGGGGGWWWGFIVGSCLSRGAVAVARWGQVEAKELEVSLVWEVRKLVVVRWDWTGLCGVWGGVVGGGDKGSCPKQAIYDIPATAHLGSGSNVLNISEFHMCCVFCANHTRPLTLRQNANLRQQSPFDSLRLPT